MRLDPLSIPYRIAENSTQIAGGVVVAGIAGSSGSGGNLLQGAAIFFGIAAVGVALVAGWNVAYYRRFRYELTEDTFDIESGVLSRRDREIPYRRIQNVDIRQNVVQRLLGIAEVRLETAGGGQTEAQLKYVNREEAGRLQEEVGRRKRGQEPSVDESEAEQQTETLYSITPRELGVLGLVSMDLRLVPFLLVALSVFGPAAITSMLPDVDQWFLIGPLVGLTTLVGLAILSGIISMLQYYDFQLRSHGDEYRYERGLLQRYSGSIPVEKVQTLSIRENVLARWLGYASLTIETAGYAPGQGSGARSQSAIPIAERDRVVELARSIEPFDEVTFERPPKRARERYAVRYLLVALLVIAGTYAVTLVPDISGPWFLSALVLPVVPIAAHVKWRHRGYYMGEEYAITRNGFWSRRITIVPTYRVQTVLSSRTIFQRRRRLASVIVDTAGSSSLMGTDAVAADIDAEQADRLREAVADRLQVAIGQRDSS
ncbi:putative membrane protein, contains bPH2 domain [Halorhabdus sp. SVX81]|uniref:PH domain-containing protein n=1 Tax=Halorhabdus sp. SVX81 TaxID=2978283 RepID=UPI0023DA25AF|nr:PH domain-containing protein [Halorhabdus sp. SVX81]WEL17399.1 putative membrane protein, contains bPH2 domain [Halorhabdus sp. SVX81]